jgi:tetratricopeptide (TPR) repeat protein
MMCNQVQSFFDCRRQRGSNRRLTRRVGALLVATVLICGCAESAESPEVLVERGHLMESRGKLDEAVDAYTRALAHRADDAKIYYDRGVALGRLGRWEDAIADYTRAIEHDSGMAAAYNNRAAALAHQRRFEPAIADFSKAIKLDSKSPLAFRNRGLAYHDLGQIGQSIEDYTVAIRLDPDSFESRFERANAYLDAGEFQKAIADYDRAIALDATRAAAWLNRGEAHRKLGHAQQSQADLAQGHRLDPNQKPSDLARATPVQALVPASSLPVSSAPAPTAPASTATPPPAARQARALTVAADFLRFRGYQVEHATAGDPFPLIGRKGDRRVLVCVQSPAEGEPVRFTRDDLDQVAHRAESVALVVVGDLTPAAGGQPFTGGTVVKFVEDWKAVRDKLVPVVFEYPLETKSEATPIPTKK